MGTYIQTLSGRKFDFMCPDTDAVHPLDVAWALSGINRFTGHTRPFYSVAQHCVRVSNMVPHELALEGLLHDAAEAYLGDISTPLKNALDIYSNGSFRKFEANVEEVVAISLGVRPGKMDPRVKKWDLIDFAIARRDLMPACEHDYIDYGISIPPLPTLEVMKPEEAFYEFILRWVALDPSKGKVFLHALRGFRPGKANWHRRGNDHEGRLSERESSVPR